MSELFGNADAAKAASLLLDRIDAIKAELSELEKRKSNHPPISETSQTDLERDVAYNVAEIEVLKNSVPEGMYHNAR